MNIVTGGGGFLGSEIVRQLLARGEKVRVLSRSDYPVLKALGAETVQCHLADPNGVRKALRGAKCVFHVAAKAGVWGPRQEYLSTNLFGTRNLLAACRERKVPKFVYTSTPSVCFDGKDHVQAGNDLPYASEYLCDYPETKAEAERDVLAQNGQDGIATVALRPHLIFGPGDPHLVPRLIQKAKKKRLRIVGPGDNVVSLTYVENAAHAHLCAADRLTPDAPCAGKPYFLGQAEPVRLWDWISELLEGLDLPQVKRHVSAERAYKIGNLCEKLWRKLRLKGEPPMTRFVAAQLATSHHYDLGPAIRDLGYEERVPLAQATRRTIGAFRG